jgi:hypothetical protein
VTVVPRTQAKPNNRRVFIECTSEEWIMVSYLQEISYSRWMV